MAGQKRGVLIDKDLRPAYYDDFHCLAADCCLSCYKGWRISFDKKDYLSLKRQSGSPELNERLDHGLCRIRSGPLSDVHYGEFVMAGGVCPLLRKDSLCALQVEKGHGALPFVCRSFPRAESYQVSGYLERSLSPACEGVLSLLWEHPEGMDFRSDPLPKEKRRRGRFPEDSVLAPWFHSIRSQCIDLLQDRRFPLPHRILLMGLALRELADGEADIPRWLERTRLLPERPEAAEVFHESGLGKELHMFLSNNIRLLFSLRVTGADFSGVHAVLAGGLGIEVRLAETQATIHCEPYLAARRRFSEVFSGREYFMENLLVSLFFHLHMPSLGSPEELWKSYVNFCNLYSFYRFLSVMSCQEGAAGNREELFRLMVFASRGLIHNNAQQSSLRDELFQNDSATLAHMAILLGG